MHQGANGVDSVGRQVDAQLNAVFDLALDQLAGFRHREAHDQFECGMSSWCDVASSNQLGDWFERIFVESLP